MNTRLRVVAGLVLCLAGAFLPPSGGMRIQAAPKAASTVSPIGLEGKVLCGYQGWFRCPGDAAGLGWVHWSRDPQRIAPETLTFEMWPDMREYGREERFAAPGFTDPEGRQAELFTTDHPATVLRHFQWMKEYDLDGVWLQHFVVDLPGGPGEARYPSRLRVLQHVRSAAQKTGRVWALSYDIAGMPRDRIFTTLTRDWKKLVDAGISRDPRYLQAGGRPVVQIWGFYHQNAGNQMTAELASQLIDFFHAPGPYAAYLVGGGDWDWRSKAAADWQGALRRLDAYSPWNVGNFSTDSAGVKRASTHYWAEDQAECARRRILWLPTVYPGFSWDNLQRLPPGSSSIPRRRGEFLWEQFYALAKMGGKSAYVAMFDEVDEGTAVFKVTSAPPTQAHFVGYDGLPSDWYLRLVREGKRMLRGERPITGQIPIKP